MRPSALLITMNRYHKVTDCLLEVKAAHDPAGVDLCVETAGDFDDVPPLLRSPVDLIALDGHGWPDGESAYFGTSDDPLWLSTLFCPEYLRSERGDGIVAPIIVLGFCWGGRDPFINALEGSLGRRQAAFLGCTDKTDFGDTKRIYLPILRLLAELGPSPDPTSTHTRLTQIAPDIGPAWRSELLSRRNDA
jgi:hypothetical protein